MYRRTWMFQPLFAQDGGTGGAGDEDPGETVSFDDFLKTADNQAEFDRRVNKAVTKAVAAAKDKWDTLASDKATEAEKLAKMTEAEKAAYKNTQKEKELAAREAKLARGEMRASAINTLAEQNLPTALADALDYTDADKCSASIESVGKAFNDAVQAAVENKLKGTKPPKNPPEGGENAELEKQIFNYMKGR